MIEYTCGFMFSGDRTKVALIEKLKPAWQAGKFNGIGGKIELGETPRYAQRREFLEEAGVATEPEDWELFAVGSGSKAKVYFFRGASDRIYSQAHTVEEEAIQKRTIAGSMYSYCLPNLSWLIPFALCSETVELPVKFYWD